MNEWNYQRDESMAFKPIPEGTHRIRIKSAEKKAATTGKQMLAFEFEVSGYNGKIFHNIVFLPDRPEITNRSLTQFFDSFKDIPEGDFNLANWVGKVGAATVKHEEYNGNVNAKIAWFVSKNNQASLPPWKEPEKSSSNGASAAPAVNVPLEVDEEVPWG